VRDKLSIHLLINLKTSIARRCGLINSIAHLIGLRILSEVTEGLTCNPQEESHDLNLSHGSLIDMFMCTGLQALGTGSSLLDMKI
jgi:hypothetical protein